jgi:hypothetical protein
MSQQLKQVFQAADGTTFDTRAEALDYMRRPMITAALNKLTADNADLTAWLISEQDEIENAFDTGTIRRITKTERKHLATALDRVIELAANDRKLSFLAEHAEGLKTTFRYPPVTRMKDEEKGVAARNTLMARTDNNAQLTDWILANKAAILAAYGAGVEKREVSPKATEALLAYRIKTAEEKLVAMKANPESNADEVAELEGKLAAMKSGVAPSLAAPSVSAPVVENEELEGVEESTEVADAEEAVEG